MCGVSPPVSIHADRPVRREEREAAPQSGQLLFCPLTRKRTRTWVGIPAGKVIVQACFDSEGKKIAFVTSGRNIEIRTPGDTSGRQTFQDPTSVTAICFGLHGRTLISGGDDRTIRIRFLEGEVNIPNSQGLGFGGRGEKEMVAAAGTAWDPRTGQSISNQSLKTGSNLRLAASQNGRFISDGISLLDLDSKSVLPFEGSPSVAYNVGFSPDGRLVAVVGNQWRVHQLESSRGKTSLAPLTFNKPPTGYKKQGIWSTAVAFSPDSRVLALGHSNSASGADIAQVELWDIPTRKLLRVLNRHYFSVWGLAFSPDGHVLAGACGSYLFPSPLWRGENVGHGLRPRDSDPWRVPE